MFCFFGILQAIAIPSVSIGIVKHCWGMYTLSCIYCVLIFLGNLQAIMANVSIHANFDWNMWMNLDADMAVAICLDPKNNDIPHAETLRYVVYTAMVTHAKDTLATDMIRLHRFKQAQQQTPPAKLQQIPPAAVQAGKRRTRMAQMILTSTTMDAVLRLYFDMPPVYVTTITDVIKKAIGAAMYRANTGLNRETTRVAVPVKLLAERAKKWIYILTSDDAFVAADNVLAQHELAPTEMAADKVPAQHELAPTEMEAKEA